MIATLLIIECKVVHMLDTLHDVYTNSGSLENGVEFEYRGYVLQQVGTESTEVAIFNRDGKKVESFTVDAFDTFTEFKEQLDELIDYNPDSISDWLNR